MLLIFKRNKNEKFYFYYASACRGVIVKMNQRDMLSISFYHWVKRLRLFSFINHFLTNLNPIDLNLSGFQANCKG